MKNPKKSKKREYRISSVIIGVICAGFLLLIFLCCALGMRVKSLEQQMASLENDSKEERKSVEVVWSEEELFEDSGQEEEPESETTDLEGKRKIYLTFDDGPSLYTEEILKILREYNVKASFFVTGTHNPKYDKMYAKIIEEGHTLGIHTYTHVYEEVYSSLEAFQADFNKLRNHIYKNTGEWINICRFPGGSGNRVVSYRNRETIFEWMESENIVYYDWNVAPEDGGSQNPTAEEIAKSCIEGVKNYDASIVLLHDAGGRESTVEALPLIIEGINRLEDAVMLPIDENAVTLQQMSLSKDYRKK